VATESIIHVVEDDQPMRESIVELLEDAGYAVHAYSRAEELLARGAAIEPGCVVSDVRMPGMDGLTLLRRLRASGSELPLMLITGHGDVAMAVRAMRAGAVDFLEKPLDACALLAAITTALRDHTAGLGMNHPETAHRLLQRLTAREYEVFEHLAAGTSNKETAAQLGMTLQTVESHRAHIMQKTGAKGLRGLVRLWLSANLPPCAK
jgi:two-component system response regulator FixJ